MKKGLWIIFAVLNLLHQAKAQKPEVKTQKSPLETGNFKELNKLARVYFAKPRLDTALLYAKDALELAEKEFGKNDTNYCNTLTLLFDINYLNRDYRKGMEYCIIEKDLRADFQGQKHPAYANCLNNIAILNYSTKNYSAAEPLYIEAMNIRKEVFGSKHSVYLESLNNLAALYSAYNKTEEAERIYLDVLNIKKEVYGSMHLSMASTLNNLASLYMSKGDYLSAEPLFLRALEINKAVLPVHHARGLINLAKLYERMGNFKAIDALYSEALRIFKETLGERHPDYFTNTSYLADAYLQMGNYAAAEPLYLEALNDKKERLGVKNLAYARDLSNLVVLYIRMGNYVTAETLMLEALNINKELAGTKSSLYSSSLNILAALYHAMGKYSSADLLFQEALKLENDSKNVSWATLNNLAALYRSMGKFSSAEPLYVEAIKIVKETKGTKDPDYAVAVNNLGFLYTRMGNYASAVSLYKEAMDIQQTTLGKKSTQCLNSKNNLASLYRLNGNYELAEPLFLDVIESTRENIFKNFSVLSEKEKELYFKTESGKFSGFYSFSLIRKNENEAITDEVYNTLLTNKGLLLKSTTAMRNSVLGGNDTLLMKQYYKWINLNKEISKLNSTEISKRKTDPEILVKEANDLEKELVKKSSSISDFEKLQNLSWKDVQKKLKKGEAAIEFINFSEGKKNDTITYCALLITPESKNPEMIRLFEEKELIKILSKGSSNDEFFVQTVYGTQNLPNTDLYNLIWKPLEKHLKGKDKIYYSPAGLLHKISFASIATGKNVYLNDKYDLQLLGSTGKIAIPEVFNLNKNLNFSIFGGIDYNTPLTINNSTALLTWPYLEGTKTESDKITNILKTKNIFYQYLRGLQASEDTFKIIAPKTNVIHIATHGFFFPDQDDFTYQEKTDSTMKETIAFRGGNNAVGVNNFMVNKNPLMRSGIVLAGANEVWVRDEYMNKEDGVLTAQEVTQMDLRKTGLVVLSACETGLGDIKGSEGVYGLQRAFKMAGVKHIIMSLWQVPDQETSEFMTTFYAKLIKTKDIKKAFNNTQKEMRKKYDPYFWAAFVLVE